MIDFITFFLRPDVPGFWSEYVVVETEIILKEWDSSILFYYL